MFNEKDILARLQKGESMDAIAAELTKAMTNAQASYDAQKEAEEKARAAELAKKEKFQEQKADMEDLLLMVEDYIRTYYPEITVNRSLVNADNVRKGIEIFDEVAGLAKAVDDLGKFLDKGDFISPVKKKTKTKDSDVVLDNFLKNMGW